MSSPIRAIGRRQLAIIVAALIAFGGFAIYRTQGGAQAHETTATLGLTCSLAGELSTTYTVTHNPLTAVPGEPLELNVTAQLGTVPENFAGFGLNSIKLTVPTPAEVTGGDVHVMGGNLTKASQTNNGDSATIELKANSGVTLGTIQMPTLMFMLTVKPGVTTTPITFHGPSTLSLVVNFLGAPVTENCTAAANNPPLATVPVQVSTPTTAAPTTAAPTTAAPTTAAPTTAAPTTAAPTTAAPTTAAPTTAAPTSTTTTTHGHDTTTTTRTPTTAAPTTAAPTTRPPTTQAPPTTQRPTDNPVLRLIRLILCGLFRIGC